MENDGTGHPWLELTAFLTAIAAVVFMFGSLLFTDLAGSDVKRGKITYSAAQVIN